MYKTLLYFKWITNKDLLQSTWTSAQCYVAAWMGGELGGEWTYVYARLSSLSVHLKLPPYCLLIGCTPIQNKKLFFFKNKKKEVCMRAFSQRQKFLLNSRQLVCDLVSSSI